MFVHLDRQCKQRVHTVLLFAHTLIPGHHTTNRYLLGEGERQREEFSGWVRGGFDSGLREDLAL